MKLQLDDLDTYLFLANEWLFEIGTILRERLQEAGLSEDQARETCGNILFDIGMLHDQHGLEGEWSNATSDPILPRLGFVDTEGDLVTVNEDTYHHEYVFRVIESVFAK
ncbi:MAG: hypothetical protein AAF340_16430 [Pseudomonadota bacterium]